MSSSKWSSICSIEKFNVKLNRIWTFCNGYALWSGVTVIPPTNFKTSKEDGCPNRDSVKLRGDWRRTRDTNISLTKLLAYDEIFELCSSGSTPKVILVVFDPALSAVMITTLIVGNLISSNISPPSRGKSSCSKDNGFSTIKVATIS